MKVKSTYIVSYQNHWQVLYELENGHYFLTTKGGFGQLNYKLNQIGKEQALEILAVNIFNPEIE